MKKYSAFLFILYICGACYYSPQRSLSGLWNLKTVETYIDIEQAKDSITFKDVSSQNLFIQFSSNGTFSTNTGLSIIKPFPSNTTTSSGTYTYVINNGTHIVLMEYYDNYISGTGAMFFELQNPNSNLPTLFMNKDAYIESLQETAANLNNEANAQALNELSGRIINAQFTFRFEKN